MATAVQNPRDVALAALDAEYYADVKPIPSQIHFYEQDTEQVNAEHRSEWGTTDGDPRRIADHFGHYHAEKKRSARVLANLNAIAERKAWRKNRTVRWERDRKRVTEETVVGPLIPVTMPTLPTEADDKRLQALAAKLAKAVEALEERRRTAAALEPLISEDRIVVGGLIARQRLGLVDQQQVATAQKQLRDEERALRLAQEEEPGLAEQVRAVETELDARRRDFRAERQRAVDRELRRAALAFCDGLYQLASLATAVERLNAQSATDCEWVVPALSADTPRSWSREMLQQAIETLGWTPPNGRS